MTWFLQRDWSTGQTHGCSVGFGIFETNTVALMILSWIKGSRFVTWSLWAVGNMESNGNDVEWCGHQFKQGLFRQYSVLASNEVKCDSKTEKHWVIAIHDDTQTQWNDEGIIGIETATNYPTTNLHRKDKQTELQLIMKILKSLWYKKRPKDGVHWRISISQTSINKAWSTSGSTHMASSNSKCWPPWSGIVGPLSSQRAYQRGIPRISIQHSPPTVHR